MTLAANTTTSVWRLPGGDPATTTAGSRPESDAVELWQAETDAAAIIRLERRHRWLGPQQTVQFVFDEPLTGSLVRYLQLQSDVPLYLLPMAGAIAATTFDTGSGSSGASEWDIEYGELGVPAAWTSVLDAGDRPSVPWDTTTRAHQVSVPAVCVLPPGPLLLRCRLVGELDVSPPAGAVVTVRLFGAW